MPLWGNTQLKYYKTLDIMLACYVLASYILYHLLKPTSAHEIKTGHVVYIFVFAFGILSWAAAIAGKEYSYFFGISTFVAALLLVCSVFYFVWYVSLSLILSSTLILITFVQVLNTGPNEFLAHYFVLFTVLPIAYMISRVLFKTNLRYFTAQQKTNESNKKLEEINKKLDQKVKERTSELEKARIKAEESDRLKSAFLANMSHEIRTPLNGILGFAQLLGYKEKTNDQVNSYIQLIQSSGDILLNIINDILDISKIEAGQLNIFHSEFNLNKLLDEMFSFFQAEASRKKLEIKLTKALGDERSWVFCDETRLRQALNNLMSNAIKFTDKGYIHVGYQKKGNNLRFFVKDTGKGILKEKQESVFLRFHQEHSDMALPSRGTGLGLPITKGILELMGGKIWLDSTPGVGTTFYFTLPYKSVRQENNNLEAMKMNQKDWKNKTILIVEDDETNYIFLEECLSNTNATLAHAQTGEEAMDYFESGKPIDLILMDIKLPGVNGFA
jgi:signal transduction histidine kinase